MKTRCYTKPMGKYCGGVMNHHFHFKYKKEYVGSTVIIAIAIAGAIAVFGGCRAVEHAREKKDTQKGITYLESMEKQDPSDVEKILAERERASRAKRIDTVMDQIDKGTVDIWSLFGKAAIIGDSRAEGFTAYGFLTTANVYAKMGASCRKASDYLATVQKQSPQQIFFTYGTNDVEGMWNSAKDYVNAYSAIIKSYQKAVPNAEIYVVSIIPITQKALTKHPNMKHIAEYNAALKQMCTSLGTTYVDCNTIMEGHENLYDNDGIHFKPSFYSIWAKKMIRTAYEHESGMSDGSSSSSQSTAGSSDTSPTKAKDSNGVTDLVKKS